MAEGEAPILKVKPSQPLPTIVAPGHVKGHPTDVTTNGTQDIVVNDARGDGVEPLLGIGDGCVLWATGSKTCEGKSKSCGQLAAGSPTLITAGNSLSLA